VEGRERRLTGEILEPQRLRVARMDRVARPQEPPEAVVVQDHPVSAGAYIGVPAAVSHTPTESG